MCQCLKAAAGGSLDNVHRERGAGAPPRGGKKRLDQAVNLAFCLKPPCHVRSMALTSARQPMDARPAVAFEAATAEVQLWGTHYEGRWVYTLWCREVKMNPAKSL